MNDLLTAAQMRAVEQAAIDSGQVTGLQLMERAGRGVVEAVFAEWPDLAAGSYRAVVLCGPGNNGGDGFVVARLLAQWGWQVDVFLYGDVDKLPPDARANCERWQQIGEVADLSDETFERYAADLGAPELAVDAIFGTGLARPFLALGRVQDRLNRWHAGARNGALPRVVSIDIPSGLCADSGRYLGRDGENSPDSAIMANLTVTFHTEKVGHRLESGPVGCGKLVTKDIGL